MSELALGRFGDRRPRAADDQGHRTRYPNFLTVSCLCSRVKMLGLQSNNGAENGQLIYGRVFAQLAPDTARYAIVERNLDNDPRPNIVSLHLFCASLAPIVALQNIINRAVACRLPDRLFIRCFQTLDVQYLSGPGGFGKVIEQSLFLGQRLDGDGSLQWVARAGYVERPKSGSCFPGSARHWA
jgi:hypothetical protein